MNDQMMSMAESIPGFTIQSVQIPDFTVEDVTIQSLNGGIKKKFTSQASPYSVVFKWDFGDGHTKNTHDRSTTHEYSSPGIYTVKHQACLLDLPCCYVNDIPWCVKTITVQAPKPPSILPSLALAGFFGFILLPKKECEDYDTKKECEKPKECQWLEEEKKCIKKCKEGYRLEKVRIDGMKRPYKYICMSVKKLLKEKK